MRQVLDANMAGGDAHNNPVPAAPPAPPAAPVPPATPQDIEPMIPNAKGQIYFNLTTLYGSEPEGAEAAAVKVKAAGSILDKKELILDELSHLTGPVNSPILWQDGADTIRNTQRGGEYHPQTLSRILKSLQIKGRQSPYYKQFLNNRIHSITNEDLIRLRREDIPMTELYSLSQAKLVALQWGGVGR